MPRAWTMPRHYMGASWDGWFVAPCGRSRDSDAIERANWSEQLERLGGEDGERVVVVRESNFLCGWVEWVALAADATDLHAIADDIQAKLDTYPILNEDAVEWEELDED